MTDTAEPAWLAKAKSYIGFHEQPSNRGLAEFIDLSHCGSEGDPWCAIFVNACLEASGIRGTRSALARSFERDPNFQKLDKPVPGAIVTMWRGSKSAGIGHVTFFTGESGGKLLGLGGNQNDQVNIEPFAQDAHITGYWWPKAADQPAGAASVAALPQGQRFTNITATVFGGPNDEQPVAYADVAQGWADRPGVALPFRFHGPRPSVTVTCNGKNVVCQIVDVGPWNVNDSYWESGARPQAESGTDAKGRHTNKAGIDLTPAAAKAIGIDGKGLVDWSFSTMTDQPAANPAPALPSPEQVDAIINTLAPVLKQQVLPAVETLVGQLFARFTGKAAQATSTPGTPALPTLPIPLPVLVQLLSQLAGSSGTKAAIPLSFIDQLFGGAMLVGKKTAFSALGGAGLGILQVLGVVGPALGIAATPGGQIGTIISILGVVLGLIAKLDRAMMAAKANTPVKLT